jgi:hypothetical protein
MLRKYEYCLSLVLALAVPVFVFPSQSVAQVPIGELQQREPGITVSGRVINVVGNHFLLRDDTGDIIVDAGPRWWHEIDVTEGEALTVTGELGRSGELDAFSVTRRDGTVIRIRPSQGPPPWAGGPNRRRPAQHWH